MGVDDTKADKNQYTKIVSEYGTHNKRLQSDRQNCHSFCQKNQQNKRHFCRQLRRALKCLLSQITLSSK